MFADACARAKKAGKPIGILAPVEEDVPPLSWRWASRTWPWAATSACCEDAAGATARAVRREIGPILRRCPRPIGTGRSTAPESCRPRRPERRSGSSWIGCWPARPSSRSIGSSASSASSSRRPSPAAATSSRNTWSACRSSARRRPSTRARIRSSGFRRGASARAWRATTTAEGQARRDHHRPSQGWIPPRLQAAGRRRDGQTLHRRGLGQPERRRRHARSAITVPTQASSTSARACGGEIIHGLAKVAALRVIAWDPAGPHARRGERRDRAHAGRGHDRHRERPELGRAPSRHHPASSTRPVVATGGRSRSTAMPRTSSPCRSGWPRP